MSLVIFPSFERFSRVLPGLLTSLIENRGGGGDWGDGEGAYPVLCGLVSKQVVVVGAVVWEAGREEVEDEGQLDAVARVPLAAKLKGTPERRHEAVAKRVHPSWHLGKPAAAKEGESTKATTKRASERAR
ncbi:MAG: hypothetical protein GY822_22110 [Deltaproteobacteria bacterium]|nr:hypothetical protein [Deltaproteobacteria bacterium]